MNVELNKEGLISLIRGGTPTYEQMEHPLVQRGGIYVGGMGDRWEWHDAGALEDMTEKELLELHNLIKHNWK